jgi:hypothetical protein
VTKASLKGFTIKIARSRRDLERLPRGLGNRQDYLAVIDARAKATDRKGYLTAEPHSDPVIEAERILQIGVKTSA